MDGDDEQKQQVLDIEDGDKVESRSTVRPNISESDLQKELSRDEGNMKESGMEDDFVNTEREEMNSMKEVCSIIINDVDRV